MKRVLMVRGEHLLADGIASLLTGQSDLNISHFSFVDVPALIEQIEEIQPSILILETGDVMGENGSLAQVLKICPEIRIIIIDDKKNLIQIYSKQEMAVARSADLLAAIRSQ